MTDAERHRIDGLIAAVRVSGAAIRDNADQTAALLSECLAAVIEAGLVQTATADYDDATPVPIPGARSATATRWRDPCPDTDEERIDDAMRDAANLRGKLEAEQRRARGLEIKLQILRNPQTEKATTP